MRVVDMPPWPPAWMNDLDEFFATDDETIERDQELFNEERVSVLSAPNWRTVLIINPNNASNLSFGCPWGCKGKVTLFKKEKGKGET